MTDRENRRYEMFSRVVAFGRERSADFAPESLAATQLKQLADLIAGIEQARTLQPGGSITSKAVLLDALRLDLKNIATTAQAIAQDEPGFADRFRLPHNPSQAALLTAVDTVLSHLQPGGGSPEVEAAKAKTVARFVAYELPADFVTQLAEDREAVDVAQDEFHKDDIDGVQNTSRIGQLTRQGLRVVNHLDAVMRNKYARQAEVIRAWESASHTERAPQRERVSAERAKPAAPAPAPA